MQIDGTANTAGAELFEVKEILIDVTGGEGQMIADWLEAIAAGSVTHGAFDDGENTLAMYIMPEDKA